MFAAYFDDSGSHEAAHAQIVCGFATSLDQWLLFERDWNTVLRMPQFDLDYLHMKELRTGKVKFAKFEDNLDLQRDLFTRLQTLIRVRAPASFGCMVRRELYAKVDADYQLRERFGGPFTFAASVSVAKVGDWMKQYHYNDDLLIVFDQGSKGWGEMSDRFLKEFGERPSRRNSKETPPLQAADLAAWENNRAVNQVIKANFGKVTFRGAYDALIARFGGEKWMFAEEDELRAFCEDKQIPRR